MQNFKSPMSLHGINQRVLEDILNTISQTLDVRNDIYKDIKEALCKMSDLKAHWKKTLSFLQGVLEDS